MENRFIDTLWCIDHTPRIYWDGGQWVCVALKDGAIQQDGRQLPTMRVEGRGDAPSVAFAQWLNQ